MNEELKQGMYSYYDERSREYEEIYSGKGPGIPDPALYKNDIERITRIVSTLGCGHLIDIGCGTGFWLACYAPNCSQITLIDQSEKMLAECKKKVDKWGLKDKCYFAEGDFLEVTFDDCMFDSALVGFLVSHFTSEVEQAFFVKVKKILKPQAKFIFIDSAWTTKRQPYREKEGLLRRTLNDGRTFTIYKRYFNKSDVEELFQKYGFKLESLYFGDVFLAATGKNQG